MKEKCFYSDWNTTTTPCSNPADKYIMRNDSDGVLIALTPICSSCMNRLPFVTGDTQIEMTFEEYQVAQIMES